MLLYIASHPDARLRALATALGITEGSVFGIVTDLVEAGYVIKERGGRRNRYHIQDDLPPRRANRLERRSEESVSPEDRGQYAQPEYGR